MVKRTDDGVIVSLSIITRERILREEKGPGIRLLSRHRVYSSYSGKDTAQDFFRPIYCDTEIGVARPRSDTESPGHKADGYHDPNVI